MIRSAKVCGITPKKRTAAARAGRGMPQIALISARAQLTSLWLAANRTTDSERRQLELPVLPQADSALPVRAPVLFVQGTADPFGSIAEVSAAIAAIPASTRLLPIDGAGHDLRRGRFDLAAVVAAFLALAPGP